MSEKKKNELQVGDVIIAKGGSRRRFEIVFIMAGMAGPYLTLKDENGKKVEHDTSFDPREVTYTVGEV